MKIRLILAASKNGSLSHEEMTWTMDFDTPAKDFVRPGLSITFDKPIEAELPDIFPIESSFVKFC